MNFITNPLCIASITIRESSGDRWDIPVKYLKRIFLKTKGLYRKMLFHVFDLFFHVESPFYLVGLCRSVLVHKTIFPHDVPVSIF